jgi:hypothetical protein
MSQQSEETRIALIAQQVSTLVKTTDEINSKLDKNYVTKDQMALVADKLDRIEKIVYGVIMSFLVGIVGGILAFFKK